MFGESDPIPCDVWQTEQEKPCSEMCVKCPPLPEAAGLKLASVKILVRSWHFPHNAYGPGLLSVAHGPDEYVDLDRVTECAAIYALTALDVLS